MAFSKNPTQDSHAVKRIYPTDEPLITSATWVSSSDSVPNNRFYNCFPLKEEQNQDDPVLRVHKRAGWTATAASGTTLPASSNRGYSAPVQALNILLNNVFYTYNAALMMLDLSTNTSSSISTTGTTNYLGTLTNAINSTNTRKICLLESGAGATTYLTTCDEDGTNVVTTNLAALVLDGSKGLVFINGYLFAANRLGNKIYNSNAAGVLTTWTSTDFLDAEQYADPIVYIEKHHNYLVAFGSASIEFFYDGGVEVGSPLVRQESYSTRVGMVSDYFSSTNSRYCARVNDDLYFVGCEDSSTPALYKISNFKVEKLPENSFIKNMLSSTRGLYQVSTHFINNNECILLEFLNSTSDGGGLWAYMISENTWIQIGGSDTPGSGNSQISKPFTMINDTSTYTVGTTVYLTGSSGTVPSLWHETPTTVDVTATYRTKMTDFDSNRYKHIARVDAVGDLNNNTITLAYGTHPNYSTSNLVTTNTITPSTIGLQNNISWYNLGAFRQFYFMVTLAGKFGIFSFLEVEYNMGIS